MATNQNIAIGMGAHTYLEYGAIVAEGPHRGMVMKTFRSREAADRWLSPTSKRTRQIFVLRARPVVVGNWAETPDG